MSGRPILGIFALELILAGFMTIISAFFIFMISANYAYGTLSGIILLLASFVIAGFELTIIPPLFRVEQGSDTQARTWIGVSMLLRVLIIYTAIQAIALRSPDKEFITFLLVLNGIALALEGVLMILMFAFKKEFMPTEEDIKATMRRMGKATVTTVSECPNCREIVEKEWVLCPQCGTTLPRLCANCGQLLTERADRCMNCGAVIEKREAIDKGIETLIALSEEDAKPEAKSARYSRLAEAYLKAGEIELALETYRKAIHFTEFDRKRCNYLVKIATILHNTGRDEEAMKILDTALELDPEDIAGARMTKGQINADAIVRNAHKALESGDDANAMALADEAMAVDPSDYHAAAVVKSTVLTRRAEKLAETGNSAEAVKLLVEAVRLDPMGQGPALAVRDKLAPGERKRDEKAKRKELRAKMKASRN